MRKGRAIIRNYIIRNDISKLSICVFVFFLQLFQPPLQVSILVFNLVLLPHSMHRSFAVSHYPHSPCHSPCQRRALHFAPPVRPAYLPKLQQQTSFSLSRNSFFSLFSFFFFFIVRRVFVFARAALCPVASLTNLQRKKTMFKIWQPPDATVGTVYISASRCITSRRVNVYKETVGRFGGFKAT